MTPKFKSRNFFTLFLTIFIFGIIYLASRNIPEESVHLFLDQAGFFAPLLFILLTFLTYILAPLSSTPLLFTGFYAFGNNVIFLMTAATILSSITNFWIARHFGRSLIIKFVGQENMEKIDKLTQNYGLLTLFILRVLQGGIHDFVSYAAGLTAMRFFPYFTVSLLGLIPGTIFWYFLALQVETPAVFTVLTLSLAAAFSLVFALVVFITRRKRN